MSKDQVVKSILENSGYNNFHIYIDKEKSLYLDKGTDKFAVIEDFIRIDSPESQQITFIAIDKITYIQSF